MSVFSHMMEKEQEKIAILMKALSFYADEDRWEGDYFYGPSCLDKGPSIAIAALKEINDLLLW